MDIDAIKKAFEEKKYKFQYFATSDEAARYLNQEVDHKTVGFGDSQTLKELGLFELLSSHNEVHSPMHTKLGETFYDAAKAAMFTDVFFTSVNGASISGELVNIDGTGNRIAGSLFCHKKVYFVLGKNKIMPTLTEAVSRARNVAAPANAKRLGKKTPCAINGDHCYNCNSPDRICNAILLYTHKMQEIDAEVILIGQDLGL